MLNRLIAACALSTMIVACGGEDQPAPPVTQQIPQAVQPAAPAPQPAPAAAPAAQPAAPAAAPVAAQPAPEPEIDLTLTDARRAAIEAAFPEAKGFINEADLELEIQAKGIEDAKKAEKMFAKKAKGKWVLFTGNMNNITNTGYVVDVIYKAKKPGNPFSMPGWILIKLETVEGFDPKQSKIGKKVAVLAKYKGGLAAEMAKDVVALGHWK